METMTKKTVQVIWTYIKKTNGGIHERIRSNSF